MCDWTNLDEIMQDLTVAQRFEVPASLETFGAVGPPPFKIEEEESAEQSYYASQGGGEGDFDPSKSPDLGLIQDMLNMVKKKKDDQQAGNPADSSHLDPNNTEYVTQNIQKKIKRNVALESIMTAKKAEVSAIAPVPKDIIPSMFKKKPLNHTSHHNMEETSKNAPPSQTLPHFVKQYTPSTHASEYYTKYLQKSELRELEEDIWARAERQMKEVEVRKKRKAEIVSPKENGNESPQGAVFALFDLNLPEHRHLMPGDCIVCIVAAKHGYYL